MRRQQPSQHAQLERSTHELVHISNVVLPSASAECELTMEETELLDGFLRRRSDFNGAHEDATRKACAFFSTAMSSYQSSA